MSRFLCLIVFLSLPSIALADKAGADACAAGLAPEAKAIYGATASGFTAASDKRGFVKSKVKSMVLAGSVNRASAVTSAEAAGDCLKQLLP